MFTKGQVDRMLDALDHPARVELWQKETADQVFFIEEATKRIALTSRGDILEAPANDGTFDGTFEFLSLIHISYLEQLDLSFYALCALMFCVGITVGNNPQILLNFKTVNPRFFLLPVLTILGNLVGCCMSSVFFNKHSPCLFYTSSCV